MTAFTFGPLLGLACVAVAGAMIGLWGLSLWLRNASIVDIFWGFGFAGIAALGAGFGAGAPARRWLLAGLAIVWGARLGAYLFTRNYGAGEDPRYQAMRRHWSKRGKHFGWVSLRTVFGLQGVLMLVVALPVIVGQSAATPVSLGMVEGFGCAVWATGLLFEAVGDAQLARFKRAPANAGSVMDRGLWAWTRHPNYFGDFLVWWRIFLVALPVPGGIASIIGPLAMSFLLMRVSGVPLLERRMARTRPGYAAYAARTSAFFPRPPRSAEGVD